MQLNEIRFMIKNSDGSLSGSGRKNLPFKSYEGAALHRTCRTAPASQVVMIQLVEVKLA